MKKTYAASIIFLALIAFIFFIAKSHVFSKHQSTIKVGVLHSLTGTMAISEKPVADAALLAIEEINKNGGVLGMVIEPVVADGNPTRIFFKKRPSDLLLKRT